MWTLQSDITKVNNKLGTVFSWWLLTILIVTWLSSLAVLQAPIAADIVAPLENVPTMPFLELDVDDGDPTLGEVEPAAVITGGMSNVASFQKHVTTPAMNQFFDAMQWPFQFAGQVVGPSKQTEAMYVCRWLGSDEVERVSSDQNEPPNSEAVEAGRNILKNVQFGHLWQSGFGLFVLQVDAVHLESRCCGTSNFGVQRLLVVPRAVGCVPWRDHTAVAGRGYRDNCALEQRG